ncbi:MAG TPA: hypothetical protein PK593_01925 [Thermomicrobiales bacterium]|nr:hypothetical protein [Thermomicrobiales bacterium]
MALSGRRRKRSDPESLVRTLNQPKELEVEADERGLPRRVIRRRQRLRVASVLDVWRIDDEWWREEISRRYFLVVLEGGVSRTIYQDLVTGEWFEQSY